MRQGLIPQIKVPENVKGEFLKACARQGRSMTDVLRQLVHDFIQNEQKKK